jgi:dihydroorotate dehydrogenase (NAD+) catalytic subunit
MATPHLILIHPLRKPGNKGMRVFEVRAGLLNSIGLQNDGVENFVKNQLPKMEKLGTNIIANLGGGTIEEYEKGAEMLNSSSVHIIELNISCPNVKEGGMAFGIKTKDAREVVKRVRKICRKPLVVKLSPNAENLTEMAKACQEEGADGLSLVNTFKAMAIDIYKRKPVFDNITCGMSGPAIKPIALRMVYEVCKCVDIPVIGLGGISDAQDAIEFIMAGASLIQVGTANFIKPDICMDIISGIDEFMKKENIKNINEIRGIV